MLDLNPIKQRAAAATEGPWFAAATDDHMCMNARYVTTTPCEFKHDNTVTFDDGMNAHSEQTICVTMLQAPDTACHESAKWDENTIFIAHARTDIPALLRHVEELEAKLAASFTEDELKRAYQDGRQDEANGIIASQAAQTIARIRAERDAAK